MPFGRRRIAASTDHQPFPFRNLVNIVFSARFLINSRTGSEPLGRVVAVSSVASAAGVNIIHPYVDRF
jgi:hypothetical protein